MPQKGLRRILHLKTFNNPKLRDFPAPDAFPRIQVHIDQYYYYIHRIIIINALSGTIIVCNKINYTHRYMSIYIIIFHIYKYWLFYTDPGAIIRLSLLLIFAIGNRCQHIQTASTTGSGLISNRQRIRYEFMEQQQIRYMATIAWVIMFIHLYIYLFMRYRYLLGVALNICVVNEYV